MPLVWLSVRLLDADSDVTILRLEGSIMRLSVSIGFPLRSACLMILARTLVSVVRLIFFPCLLNLKSILNDLVLVFKIIHCFTHFTCRAIFPGSIERAVLRKKNPHGPTISGNLVLCFLIPSTSNSRPLEMFKFNPNSHSLWNSLPIEISEIAALSLLFRTE